MQRTGAAVLPLHHGRAPKWLFERMTRLARAVTFALAELEGPDSLLERLADPFWFQAFGCLLGFDWHSSGLTTTVCGALKEALSGCEEELGLGVAGGKGKASRRTPDDLRKLGDLFGFDAEKLVQTSRLVAKVDNNAVQDGYQLYHHTFVVNSAGQWVVVQQGMREGDATARRYHWLGRRVQSFVCDPHAAVCADFQVPTLNLVAQEANRARAAMTELSHNHPDVLVKELETILEAPRRHFIAEADIDPSRLRSALEKTYEAKAETFEQLLGLEGVGAKTLRALALLSELLAGAPPSWRDPARYAFAHGGKDGHPYPVDRTTYDATIATLEDALRKAKIGQTEKLHALERLHSLL